MKVVKPLPALLLASVVVLSILGGASVPAVAQRNDDFARQQQEQQRRQQQDEQRRQQQDDQRRQQQEEQRRQRQEEQRRQQDDQRRQQQDEMRRQQQDQMRQQQRDQARQQQDDLRRQQQADMRRQTQDEQRRAMQQEQKNQQRQQTQQAQKDQQREQQKQATQAQMRDQQKGQQTKAQQQQDTKQLQQAQKDQLAGRAPKAGTPASVISRTTDRMVFSNGVAKLTRPLTADEAKRGFTGKVTADGRPLVAFQNRVFAVPAARAGFTPPKTSTSQAALASRWSPQKQSAVKNDIQKLAGIQLGGGAGSKAGITAKFNSTVTRNGDVVKVSSPQVQTRIDQARLSRTTTTSEQTPHNAGRSTLKLDNLDKSIHSQVMRVVGSFDETGKPPPGVWQGGRRGGESGRFENSQQKLPARPPGYYTESDVHPGKPGNRGPDRLVFGKEGEVYYTSDHYENFKKIR